MADRCCKLDPTHICHFCRKEKCIDCVHILIEGRPGQNPKGCYCYTCMEKHSTLWVSCFTCDGKVHLIDKPKCTMLDLYLKCDGCEIKQKK